MDSDCSQWTTNRSKWFPIDLNVYIWIPMDPNKSQWTPMNSNRSQYTLLYPNGFKSVPMDSKISRLIQMDPDNSYFPRHKE